MRRHFGSHLGGILVKPTRREFMIAATTAVCAVSLSGGHSLIPGPLAETKHVPEPLLFEGDPYTAHVEDRGLGGRSWEEACEHALRFRSAADDRDRYVLGLEI
jgi:hypothetical protein